jgi:D-tyrosyl-tRNA(Tyr) deacylase
LRKGTRPSFSHAAPSLEASDLYEKFVQGFRDRWPGRVQAGRFGADMQVSLVNDGPVTLILDK